VHDVEPIGPQPQERGVHAVGDAAGRPVRHAWNAVAHLGGEDHALAPACESAPQPLLGEAVAARGVDQRHARVQRSSDQAIDVGLAGLRSSDATGAESECAHGQARLSQRPQLHSNLQRPSE